MFTFQNTVQAIHGRAVRILLLTARLIVKIPPIPMYSTAIREEKIEVPHIRR